MGNKVSKKNNINIIIPSVQSAPASSTQIDTPSNAYTSPASSSKSDRAFPTNKITSFSDLPLDKPNKQIPQSISSSNTTVSLHNRTSSDPLSNKSPKKSILDLMHERMHQDFLSAKDKRLKEEAAILERRNGYGYQIAINGKPLKINSRPIEIVEKLFE